MESWSKRTDRIGAGYCSLIWQILLVLPKFPRLQLRNVRRYLRQHVAAEENAVQALTLMIVYILTTITVQFIGFLISRLVDYQYPALGLMTFLVLYLGAFGIAWPIAVRIAEWVIQRAGYEIEKADARAT